MSEGVTDILQQLRDGKIERYVVEKDQFLDFRAVLTKQEDFLSFRGAARHNGHVIYTYQPGWTK